MTTPDYPWPCSRRDAHGPHDDVDTSGMTNEAILNAMQRPGDELTCPGVRAHPATMIGRPPNVSPPNDTTTSPTNDTFPCG